MRRVEVTGLRGLVGREVSAAVGVTPSAAYRHFPSHGHLLAAVSR
ncbi:MAG: TetR family transcriptional regulator, partial [Proteobacteria bacterium]|nr:TetR family transcriptional regulator [Pseudomonadota bacterium]